VLAQDVDQLQADGVTEGLGDLRHPQRLVTLDVGVDNGLATGLAGRTLSLWLELQIDVHQFTYIY